MTPNRADQIGRPLDLSPREGAVLDMLAAMHREYQEAESFTSLAVAKHVGGPCAGSLGSLVEYKLVRRLQSDPMDDRPTGDRVDRDPFAYQLTQLGISEAHERRRAREQARMTIVRPKGRASAETRELPKMRADDKGGRYE